MDWEVKMMIVIVLLGVSLLIGVTWLAYLDIEYRATAPCEAFKNRTIQYVPLRCLPK